MPKLWKIGLTVTVGFAYALWNGQQVSRRKRNSKLASGKRFVIVGAGFAGSEAAQELSRLLAYADPQTEIILIDERDYLLFTPMLTESVGAQIEPHHIIVPLRSLSPRIRIVRGSVSHINLATRTVALAGETSRPIVADYLVIALGASSNFHHIPGAEQAAYSLKTLDDANGIRHNVIARLKSAGSETNPAKRKADLTVLVAGGGYTGVEAIAALNELLKERVARSEALSGASLNMLLVEPMGRLMSEVTPDLASYAQKQLETAGIRILLNVGVKSVNGDEVELTNGERIQAGTFIWTAGIEANPLVAKLGAPTGKSKGFKVDGCFAVPGFPQVWAVGDCAEVPRSDGKGTYGATAQNATRQGHLVAQNIVRLLRGEQPQPFGYKPVGELALVGKRKGVARIYNVNFSGSIAYALWRAVYLAKMPSMTQRLRVLGDWVLDAMLGPAAEIHVASTDPKAQAAQAQS